MKPGGAASSPMAIGEVLTALRSDFPDITVSKIRFLDGAGLVNPQRSGSGYRRFSDADLLRLRQVLVLQRDHYLPLKVIRAHIAAGTLDRALAEAAHAPLETPAPQPADPPAPDPRSGPPSADQPADRVATDRGAADPVPAERVAAERVSAEWPAAERAPAGSGESGNGSSPAAAPAPSRAPAAARPPVRERALPSALPSAPSAPIGPPAGLPAGRAPVGTGGANPAVRAFAGHPRRLRVEDLLRLSGLPIETLTELETAGLLRSRNGWYHPEDLAVALAAAQLAAHGIGPRHLRSLRNAADRELGLLEQSLVPVLRRARPDARTRAEDTARTLRELYAQVHTALVTAGLRDLGIDPR